MRLRPYRKSKDFPVVEKWIDDRKTHALWCADMIPYPLALSSFHAILEENERLWNDCAYMFSDDNGTPIGFLGYGVNEKENFGFVKYLLIAPSYRGQGYGRKMLELLLQYAYTINGVSYLRLNVFDNNENAIKCYEAVGFRKVAHVDNVFSFQRESWGRYTMVTEMPEGAQI